MKAGDFASWMRRHVKALGIAFPADLAAVSGWCGEFTDRGITATEAHAATSAMLACGRRVPLGEQLGWILGHAQRERQRRSYRVMTEGIRCDLCLDVGILDIEGEGRSYCECDRGQSRRLLHEAMRRMGRDPLAAQEKRDRQAGARALAVHGK